MCAQLPSSVLNICLCQARQSFWCKKHRGSEFGEVAAGQSEQRLPAGPWIKACMLSGLRLEIRAESNCMHCVCMRKSPHCLALHGKHSLVPNRSYKWRFTQNVFKPKWQSFKTDLHSSHACNRTEPKDSRAGCS